MVTKEQFQKWAKTQVAEKANHQKYLEATKAAAGSMYKGFDPVLDQLFDEQQANNVRAWEINVAIAQHIEDRLEPKKTS